MVDNILQVANFPQQYIVVNSAEAIDKQVLFVYDSRENRMYGFCYLKPRFGFWARVLKAIGYVTESFWPVEGNWCPFEISPEDGETFAAFLKKLQPEVNKN